jgi:RNA polymerase subunit RPABC4/transcription elongation factor Spt4
MSIVALGLLSVVLVCPAPVDEEYKCSNCDKQAEADWNFCPFCGEPLKLKCPKCGKVWDREFEFCPKCSTPLRKKAGVEPKEEEPVVTNTPGSVAEDFLLYLRKGDSEGFDRIVGWEEFHQAYLKAQKVDPETSKVEDFQKMIREKLFSEEVQEKTRKMVKSRSITGEIKIRGPIAEIPVTLVNPENPEEKLSQVLTIKLVRGAWRITFIDLW